MDIRMQKTVAELNKKNKTICWKTVLERLEQETPHNLLQVRRSILSKIEARMRKGA
jgi:hypothetical protein